MPRTFLIIFLLASVLGIGAAPVLERIVLNEDNAMVSRIVLYCSEATQWSVHKDNGQNRLLINLKNAAGISPGVERPAQAGLVEDLAISRTGQDVQISVTTAKTVRVEYLDMQQPFRAVVDIIIAKPAYSYRESMTLAAFYSGCGKYYKANAIYNRLAEKHNDYNDLNYSWGKLLEKQQNYPKAMERLSLIPADSKYYAEAQSRLCTVQAKSQSNPECPAKQPDSGKPLKPAAGLPAGSAKQPEPSKTVPDKVVISKTSDKRIASAEQLLTQKPASPPQTQSQTDTLSKRPDTSTKTSQLPLKAVALASSFWTALTALPVWLWLLVLLVVLIVLFIVLDTARAFRRHAARERLGSAKQLPLQDEVKTQMVGRLAAGGWKVDEIARELRLTPKEVQAYLKHSGNQ